MGVIIPRGGVDEEYDKSTEEVEGQKAKLETFLGEMRKKLKCSTIKYFGTGKNQYQMEIPEEKCGNLPKEFQMMSRRKVQKKM